MTEYADPEIVRNKKEETKKDEVGVLVLQSTVPLHSFHR